MKQHKRILNFKKNLGVITSLSLKQITTDNHDIRYIKTFVKIHGSGL